MSQNGKVSKQKLAKSFVEFYLKLKRHNIQIEDGEVKKIITSEKNGSIEKWINFIDKMPLQHIKYLKAKNDIISMDNFDLLYEKDIIEIMGFLNRKIIEYYFNNVKAKRITEVINKDIKKKKKKIDWSIFNYGWTIPKERHDLVNLLNDHKLLRGNVKSIKISIKGKIFNSKLRSVNRQSKSDTLQIRYDNNGQFISYLKNIFKNSWEKLNQAKDHKSKSISEYFLLFYHGKPNNYQLIPLTEEDELSENFWWVNQGQTYEEEIDNKCIWAPIKNEKGQTFFHWRNVSKVKSGDIILHYRNGEIFGFSIANSDADSAKRPFDSEQWDELGWKVDLDYNLFEQPIPLDKFSKEIYEDGKKYFPIASDYSVNQGYLYKLDPKQFKKIVSKLSTKKDQDLLSNKLSDIGVSFTDLKDEKFMYLKLFQDITNSGLYFTEEIVFKFIASLCTKKFLILTGLSGSGKTKLAQAFVKWISAGGHQYSIVTVGSDWTNREPLLGYPNAIEKGRYVKPHNNVVDLLINASRNPESPYFLILDEMNLSHVERYFADFLSAMESGEAIQLHEGGEDEMWKSDTGIEVPGEIKIPENLFIIGTVNIDETTYMFSPKVLDRANVIEFRVAEKDIDGFLDKPVKPDLDFLEGRGSSMGRDFVKIAGQNIIFQDEDDKLKNILMEFFKKLQGVGAEFGYRTASEIMALAGNIYKFTTEQSESWALEKIADAAIMQKLLPKLHGSRKKLGPVLESLAELCVENDSGINIQKVLTAEDEVTDKKKKFPKSLEKIIRMYKRLMQN